MDGHELKNGLLMNYRIHQLILPLDYEEKDLRAAVCRKLGCRADQLLAVSIVRRSVDSRPRCHGPVFVLSVEVRTSAAIDLPADDVEAFSPEDFDVPPVLKNKGRLRPVVVGAGPAGLMAALTLAGAGLNPLILERGASCDARSEKVRLFWKHGSLDPQTNVLFGEGGAGLFSDGKLTSRSKDRPRVRRFLDTLVRCGAPENIRIDAEPHLGSDALMRIVPKLRRHIEENGGEFRFNALLEDMRVENGSLRALRVNGSWMDADACMLAAGHSARDMYGMLDGAGATLAAKPFAVGVRLELAQDRIDRAQWGRWAGHPRLGAAAFRLTHSGRDPHRACYTFCMCPGGEVIPCASAPGEMTTNGMSYAARSGAFANAAFLVPVDPQDFPASENLPGVLAGCEFQADIERAVFASGGSDYSLPASDLESFLKGRAPEGLPRRSWARSRPADIRRCLPDFVADSLADAIPAMLKRLKGVGPEEVLLYAAETRSSSPVRVLRGKDGQALGVRGLFPCGEGSGYAGGIVSSAVDGIIAAEALLFTDLPSG